MTTNPGVEPPRPSQPAARTRSVDLEPALIEAAERVLETEGLAGMTVRAVAKAAGVAPMGVYNRFGSKEGLVDAVLARGFQGLAEAIRPPEDMTDPIDRLRAAGIGYRTFGLGHHEQYRAMFAADQWDSVPGSDLDVCSQGTFNILMTLVEQACRASGRADIDPLEQAQMVWATVHGAVSLELDGRVVTPDPGATYGRLLNFILGGLITPTGPAAASLASPADLRGLQGSARETP